MSLGVRGVVVTLHVGDLDRARRFYDKTFGLPVLRGRDDEAILDAGSGTRLVLVEQADFTPSGRTAFSIEVADLRACLARLAQKGIRVMDYDLPGLRTEGGVWEQDYVRNAWFTDPEGNVVSIHEPKDSSLKVGQRAMIERRNG